MKKIVLIFLFLQAVLFSANLEAIVVKHDWSIKKIKKIETILNLSKKEFKSKEISLADLTSWNTKLFEEKKRKLDIEYEYRVKENPNIKGCVDFEESLNYVSSLLNISIEQLRFYEEFMQIVKKMIESGSIDFRDLQIYGLDSMSAYSQYDYALSLYKSQHPKEKIPYRLPDIKKVILTAPYLPIEISRFGDIVIDGKTKYYQISFETVSFMKREDLISYVKEAIIYLDLLKRSDFYTYKGDKSIDKKILNFFKTKGDVKSLKIEELILQ